MPQSLKQAKNQLPLKITSQYVVDYMASLMLKTAPLNYPGKQSCYLTSLIQNLLDFFLLTDMPEKLKKLPISQLVKTLIYSYTKF